MNPTQFLESCDVDSAVWELRPDYVCVLVAATGLGAKAPTPALDALVHDAEQHATALLERTPVAEIPHLASWRSAFQSFGAKPSDYKSSVEALVRRAPQGLPRINALTDVYHALSVLHGVPIGGENMAAYQGAARLIRALGTEAFDTVVQGESVIEHPKPGEVVWCDDAGVTCRRWNWRQGQRTQLTADTTDALFILDTLDPLGEFEREALVTDLVMWLELLGSTEVVTKTLMRV